VGARVVEHESPEAVRILRAEPERASQVGEDLGLDQVCTFGREVRVFLYCPVQQTRAAPGLADDEDR
jgi:hypothetical protein